MRHGKLKFTRHLILGENNDYAVLKEIQKHITMVSVDSDFISDTLTYYGVSDLFEDVSASEPVPWYLLQFKRVNNGVLIVDVTRIANDFVKDWLK